MHKRESQGCLIGDDGTLTERRIVTSRERFIAVFGSWAPARVLLEASTESEWVAQCLEALGHTVIVADPNYAPFAVLGPVTAQIAAADRRITALMQADPAVARLATAPSIGALTASAIVATIDDVTRFPSAHQFEAFLGLVPSERSSGEQRRVGRITKTGNARARYLLVEAAWRIVRSKSPETVALRAWALTIAARRGAGSASRSWPSRAGAPGFCTRCGGMGVRTMRRNCGCRNCGCRNCGCRDRVWPRRREMNAPSRV